MCVVAYTGARVLIKGSRNLYIHICTYVCVHMYIHIYTYVYTYMNVCICGHLHSVYESEFISGCMHLAVCFIAFVILIGEFWKLCIFTLKTVYYTHMYSTFPQTWDSKLSLEWKSISSIFKVEVSFQMNRLKRGLWWLSRISMSISTTISSLILLETGCIYICAYIYTYIYICIYVRVCIHGCIQSALCAGASAGAFEFIGDFWKVYIHILKTVYMLLYIYIYTYILK